MSHRSLLAPFPCSFAMSLPRGLATLRLERLCAMPVNLNSKISANFDRNFPEKYVSTRNHMKKDTNPRICFDRIIPDPLQPRHALARDTLLESALQHFKRNNPRELFH